MKKPEKIMLLLLKEFRYHKHPTLRRTSKIKNPYKTLISCLLSLRTQDKNTAKASKSLFKIADTPEKISKLPIKKLEKLVYSSGHYKKKSRTIKEVSKILIEKHNSKVPNTKPELLAIKGIGPKTANIVLSFAYGQNVIAVDTHVHRIPNRLGLVKTKTPEQTEPELGKLFPKKYWREINTTFILFGKNICLPISPKCSQCPLNSLCPKVGVGKRR
ncbi:MAG: endonuclease III [Nanoarchaeota archaeon]|nr:endonuclease III [Nanoarchaeota archaeon]MBU1051914.1 endonuclease III [Nanoarchaeota archaeon]